MNLPRVSVIITSYHAKAQAYIDLCVQSIRNLSYAKELLDVIIVAPSSYAPQYEGVRTISPPEAEYGMPRGLNFGMNASDAEFMFVLNDDVMLTRDCLQPLVSMYRGTPGIGLLMPYGNDSNLNSYALATPINGPYKIEQAPVDYMEASSPYPPGLIIKDTLCLYAFLISREVFDKVGPFDTGLIGQDDIDYSWRSLKAGYVNAINIASLVFHAGGASNTLTPERRDESMRIFNKKWGIA